MGIGNFFKRIFGTSHERMMRKIQPIVDQVNSCEESMKSLSDGELRALTSRFKEEVSNGRDLDSLIPEAFAVVREASSRVLGMRHYDVQLIGGVALHRGMIAEMKTGEGKTLVATCPMYLNALTGKGAHLVTVNDYLAERDADWMGQIYKFLGLSVGKILTDMSNTERRQSYNCDITYGTNNEFGFDYLRDNMKFKLSEYVQREHSYAIVDEVDSILIDEARTPLIISGQIEQDLNLYYEVNKLVPFLKRDEDYTVDEKLSAVALNESGTVKLEKFLGIDNIYEPKYIEYLHHVNKALQAHTLYKKDQNYIVDKGKVVIVDDFTGRLMPGRRWSDGLHQAIEAKEGVEIQAESRTLATITFQNYFRMYDKLAGMTGTADTEAEEFKKIYKLDVVAIPTHQPIVRIDYMDAVYRSEREKLGAVVQQIEECHSKGQPILVGTISVEKSEVISQLLKKKKLTHNVLNAKNHKREAEIIAQAGRKGAITIATNMAGRGTDILLGGNSEFLAKQEAEKTGKPWNSYLGKYQNICAEEKREVIEQGGLFILGTERHDSRRIDNQLRGRAGRQGDPGSSRFYLSLEDDLMRIFGADRLVGLMDRLQMEPGVPIEHSMINNAIEGAQKKVEGRNFDTRKSLLEYDDVMNDQRKTIYDLRRRILEGKTIKDDLLDAFGELLQKQASKYLDPNIMYEDWDILALTKKMESWCGFQLKVNEELGRGDRNGMIQHFWNQIEDVYDAQEAMFGEVCKAFATEYKNNPDANPYKGKVGKDLLEEYGQTTYLNEIDQAWRDHLTTMTALREAIRLRGYAQRDPKQEYKREAYDLFVNMRDRIHSETMTKVLRIRVEVPSFDKRQSRGEQISARELEKRKLEENARALAEKKATELQNLNNSSEQAMATRRQNNQTPSMAELMGVERIISERSNAKPAEEKRKSSSPSMTEIMAAKLAEEKRKFSSPSMAEIMAAKLAEEKRKSSSPSMAELMGLKPAEEKRKSSSPSMAELMGLEKTTDISKENSKKSDNIETPEVAPKPQKRVSSTPSMMELIGLQQEAKPHELTENIEQEEDAVVDTKTQEKNEAGESIKEDLKNEAKHSEHPQQSLSVSDIMPASASQVLNAMNIPSIDLNEDDFDDWEIEEEEKDN